MKKYLLSITLILVCNFSFGQLSITPGTKWVNNGAAVTILNDIDLINNGAITAGGSVIKFTGNANTIIGGNTISSFNDLEMAKTGSNKVAAAKKP
jgi:hypothetical protein